jgi:hypothetical protein
METLSKSCQTLYRRRTPELTPCYKIINDHLNTFISDRASEGSPLPDYIIEEFNAYLECGIPAFGFLRLKCKDCDGESIIAFSCKKRGFCPACCGKRMAEASSHMVSHVLPMIPYRQYVLYPFQEGR